MPNVLAFDIGGTKIAWGVVTEEGKLLDSGSQPTPNEADAFLQALHDLAVKHKAAAVGIGFPGPIHPENGQILQCTNLPKLVGLQPVQYFKEKLGLPAAIENDARCALIGEAWLGAAKDQSSAVMITLGTGVGGAVMQKNRVLPAPLDVTKEISRIVADPSNPFPGTAGPGTVEALIGGRSIEERFDVDLHELAQKVRKGDEEAVEIWQTIAYYFLQAVRAIHDVYSCKMIIVGGKGVNDLQYYSQEKTPCPVVAAELGEQAGLFGAARIGLDAYEAKVAEDSDDEWD